MSLSSKKKGIGVGVIVLIVILGVFWVWFDSKKTGRLIAAGNEALQAGNWQEAIEQLSQARRRAPNSPDVLYGLAKANVELGIQDYKRGVAQYRGRFQEAEALIGPLLQVTPENADAYLARAEVEYYLDRVVQAENSYRETLRRSRNSFEATLGLGRALYTQALKDPQRTEEAAQTLRKATEMRAGSEDAWRLLGELFVSQGNLPGASEAVSALMNLGRALSGEGEKTVGKILFLQGRYPEAREHLEKAVSSIKSVNERELVENRYLLGTCCFFLKDFDNAREHLRQARRSAQQEVYPLVQWGQFLTFDALMLPTDPERERKLSNAQKTFEEASKKDPQNGVILHLLAQAFFRLEQLDQARESLQRLTNAQPENVSARFDLANVQYRIGAEDQAIRNYQDVLKSDPKFDLASYNLGSLFLKRAGYGEAVQYLRQAVESNPDLLEARLNLAQAYLAQKKFAEAKAEYGKVLEAKPDEVQALSGLGMINQREGDLEGAQKLFQQVVQMAQGSERGHLLLARSYLQQGNLAAAVKDLEEAVRINPQNYAAQIQLGNAYLETAQPRSIQSAVDLFEGLRNNPNRSIVRDALTGLALAKLAQGDFASAQDKFNEILRLPNLTPKDQSEIYVNIGNAYLKQNRMQEAQENYEKALALDATLAEANYNLGRLFQAQDRFSDARAKYMMAMSADSSLAAAPYNLGVLYEARGDFNEAEKYYRSAIESDPSLAVSYLNLANVYYRRDKSDDAMRLLNEARQINPGLRLVRDSLAYLYYNLGKTDLARAELNYPNPSPQALRLLGMMEYREGKISEAVTQLKNALNGEGASPSLMTLTNLGTALLTLGNLPEAERYLTQAREMGKKSVEVLNNLGALYAQTGRYDQAMEALRNSLALAPDQPAITATLEKIEKLE